MPRPVFKGTICGNPVSVYRRVTKHMDEGDNGICCKRGGKFIVSIRPGLPRSRELEIIIHELLHAADWYKDEEWVEDAGNDIAKILVALGYG